MTGTSVDISNWSLMSLQRATVSSSSSLEDASSVTKHRHPMPSPIADPLSILSSSFDPLSDPRSMTTSQPNPVRIESLPPVTNPLASITPVSYPSLMQTTNVPIMPSLPSAPNECVEPTPVANNSNTVPEFLYQLTKMLTDNNREVIEWSNAKIEVHNPHRLASEILHKYFRHSKFASFQRQLNYFGFRKLAGKGKMAPCSYVNDATTTDLRSLLLIKVRLQPVKLPNNSCYNLLYS